MDVEIEAQVMMGKVEVIQQQQIGISRMRKV